MPEPDTAPEARRILRICQACMYCEGFCAAFPALGRLRDLSEDDLDHLASLCHGCRDCYFACQYAAPHVFDVNVPRTLARVRQASYAKHAWPRGLGGLFRSNGRVVALSAAVAVVLALAATLLLVPSEALFAAHRGEGAFYQVIPWTVMAGAAAAALAWACLGLGLATASFWRAIRPAAVPSRVLIRALPQAMADIVTLRNLAGGGTGCREAEGTGSQLRRALHQSMVAGLGLCVLATSVAGLYGHVFGWQAPYPVLSLPVLSGLIGGVLLTVGAAGLMLLKRRAAPEPLAPETLGGEAAMLALLAAVGATGLIVLAVRDTAAMGAALALHLGLVVGFLAVLPASKIVHAPFRAAALLRDAIERQRATAETRRNDGRNER
ncbi:tricarballylate utilization 4Fe-4S protein TcuB [Blastochloris sulfoviridis]|uniref:Tricarballylate utilization 4Fe-4S protein TcuB n=1 Tax=Blastochloris sulfoviridis TaxID=50712 RepID=A0A5M6HKF8_9HYPH|nr:tricarballylate utilization 4Fe-4S protein TcuB [Blastochloris sulfoviridis]KAA5596265.1 tricarballylate utilization 4Fe-4S protein TcuB [Blastochloris sulfoviridis]